MLEKTELPDFISRFLRSIYSDSITHVEFAGVTHGQFLYGQGCKTGLSSEWFSFLQWPSTLSSDGSRRLLFPRNPDNLDFLQPTQCAFADDLAVAALSFRGLMTALAPAFRSVDYIAGLNLNYRNCCWVQHGTEGRESLWLWVSEKCEEFREMQNVRHAIYVGTMIGPDGYVHR